MRLFKRIIPALLIVLCCAGIVSAVGPELTAETAVLIDAETGQVLYDKNMHQQMFPASITKVVTTITGLENLELSEKITMSHFAVFSLPVGSSHISLDEGEEITVEQALYAALLMSANDACNGIAEASAGSIENFTVKMNEIARRVGAKNSNFVNAHGISEEGHLTTAYDMAMICRYALGNETFRKAFGTYKYVMPPNNKKDESRTFINQHYMISDPNFKYEGVIGGKTGWTTQSKHTLVTAAERDGRCLVAVVMKCPKNEDKYNDTAALFDYGFTAFDALTISAEDFPEDSGYTLSTPCNILVEKGIQKENITLTFDGSGEVPLCIASYPDGVEIVRIPCENIPEPEVPVVAPEEEEDSSFSILTIIIMIPVAIVGAFLLLVLGLYIRKKIYKIRKRRRKMRRR